MSVSGTSYVLTSAVNGSILVLASGITVDGSNCALVYRAAPGHGNSTAVEIRNATNDTAEYFHITGPFATGIEVNDSASVTVYDSAARAATRYGLWANDSTAVNFTADNTSLSADGVYLEDTVNGVVEESEFLRSTVSAIAVNGASEIEILDNDGSGSRDVGAYLQNDSGTTVAGNDFSGASHYGIYLAGGGSEVIRGNNLGGSAGYGVYQTGASDGSVTVDSNDIANTTSSAIYVGSDIYGSFEAVGNDLSVNNSTGREYGIYVEYVELNVNIEENNLSGGWEYGVWIDEVYGSATVDSNDIANTTYSAIYTDGDIYGSFEVVGNDLSVNNRTGREYGIYVEYVELNVNIEENNLSGGWEYGVQIYDVYGSATVDSNDIANTTYSAIYADNGIYGDFEVVGNDLSVNNSTGREYGIYVYYAELNVSIEENNLAGGWKYGIYSSDGTGDSLYIEYNDIANTTYSAIYTDGYIYGSFEVVGNDLSVNSSTGRYYGIYVYYVELNVSIEENNLAGGWKYGIFSDDGTGDSLYIEYNDIANTTYSAIYVDDEIYGDFEVAGNDLSVNSSTGRYYGIYVYYVELSVSIEENNLAGGWEYGIFSDDGTGASLYIEYNDIANTTYSAIYVDSDIYGSFEAVGNDLSVNNSTGRDSGIFVYDVDLNMNIEENNLSGGWEYGVLVYYVYGGATVDSNDIANTTYSAIYVDDGIYGGFEVVGNDLSVNNSTGRDYGIYGYAVGLNVNIEENNLSGGWEYGIYLDEPDGYTNVAGNDVAGTTEAGIYIYAPYGPSTVANNDLARSGGYGIAVVNAQALLTLSGNSLQGSKTAIAVTGSAAYVGSVVVEDNNATGSDWALYLALDSRSDFAVVAGNDFSNSEALYLNQTLVNFTGNDLLGITHEVLVNDTFYLFYHNDVDTSPGSTLDLSGSSPVGGMFGALLPVGGNYWSACPLTSVTRGIGAPACRVPGTSFTDPYPLAQPWYSYAIAFTESGLPAGTSWSVTIAGVGTLTGVGPQSIEFFPPNGEFTEYAFAIRSPSGYSSAPSSGTFTAQGRAQTIVIAFRPVTYTTTFTESGLPAGTSWAVTLNGQTLTNTTPTITFTEPNGTYAYNVSTVAGWTTAARFGSVLVSGAAVRVTVAFTQVTYAVTFTETGLPSGTNWSVAIASRTMSSTSASVTVNLVNGTYAYSIPAVSRYIALPATGTVNVTGAGVSVSVGFAFTHAVTFSQIGLPGGTFWSVTLTTLLGPRSASGGLEAPAIPSYGCASTSTTCVVFVPNGTYAYGISSAGHYAPLVGGGTVTVNGASPPTISATYAFAYTVTFTETGLPASSPWQIRANGTLYTATGTTIAVLLPNGTYTFFVTGPAGYVPLATNGVVSVSGSNAAVTVPFFLSTAVFTVTFTETGLPAGTSWSVYLGTAGFGQQSNSSSMSFNAINGGYNFTIGSVSGYSASPSSGSFTVANAAQTQAISFSSTASSIPGWLWYVIIAVIVIIIIVIIVVFLSRRGKGPAPAAAPMADGASKSSETGRGEGPAAPAQAGASAPPPSAPSGDGSNSR